MSVIQGAAMRCRTMADGSLRIEIEVEPRDAIAAFTLFGAAGAPVALAALKPGHEAKSDEPDAEPAPKGGPLSKLAGQWCAMPEFRLWAAQHFPFLWRTATDELRAQGEERPAWVAAEVIRLHCGVDSRAELDHDETAGKQFNLAFRQPFSAHLQSQA